MTMCKPNRKRNWSAQRGYAMLGIVAAIGVAATTVLVTALSSTAIQNEQERRTNAALALAKQALIGRAAVGGPATNHPGSLPCPDNWPAGSLNVGTPTTPCANASEQIGRLPWKTLGLPDLRDADGERLWYAVSPNFRDVDTNIVNSNTVGQIYVTGTISANYVAAIVIAPGAQIHDQQRHTEIQQKTVSNYLESLPYPGYPYYAGSAGANYNDRLMVIASADIFAVVQKRVAKEVQDALNAYFAVNNKYPFAASLSNSACFSVAGGSACGSVTDLTTGLIPAAPEAAPGFAVYTGSATLLNAGSSDWFEKNRWRDVVRYTVSPECATTNPSPCATGSLSVTFNGIQYNNQKAVLAFAGVPNGSTDQIAKTILLKGVP